MSLRANLDEQARLTRVLSMWFKVEEQGIEPEDVQCFKFNLNAVTAEQAKHYYSVAHIHTVRGQTVVVMLPFDFWYHTKDGRKKLMPYYFNIAVMKNGESKILNPLIEAPPYTVEELEA